jgi:tRNA A37 threonylcarbamoyladenosine modification protein TsaB
MMKEKIESHQIELNRLELLILTGVGDASFALIHNNGQQKTLLASKVISMNRQSEELLPSIIEALHKEKRTLQEIQTIYYLQGPGGFSSLRRGIAIIQGIKDVKRLLEKPLEVIGLSTLAVFYFLHQAKKEHGIAKHELLNQISFEIITVKNANDVETYVLFDAKMNEYYQQKIDMTLDIQTKPHLIHRDHVEKNIEKISHKYEIIDFTAENVILSLTKQNWEYFLKPFDTIEQHNNVFIDYVRHEVAQTIAQRQNNKISSNFQN